MQNPYTFGTRKYQYWERLVTVNGVQGVDAHRLEVIIDDIETENDLLGDSAPSSTREEIRVEAYAHGHKDGMYRSLELLQETIDKMKKELNS